MPIILALKVDETKYIKRGQDYLWKVIRDLTLVDRDRPFFLSELMKQMAGTDSASVKLDLARMVKAGLIAPQTSAAGPCWRALKRPTKLPTFGKDGAAPRPGIECMWTAMRALKTFDARELAVAASTEERIVEVNTAKTYLRRLFAAGYLSVARPATKGRGGRIAAYRLKPGMNTGPEAPKILRTHLVYDPNRNEVMGLAEAEEAT